MNANFTQSEKLLIEGCLKGDRKQQKALYDLYSPKVFPVCLRYTKNRLDAEDVLQEGFMKLFNNLDKFKGEGSFEGWIRRIFVNTSIEYLRRKKLETVGCDFLENAIVDREPSGLQNLYNKDLVETTKTLSKGFQTIFNLYAVEGFTHQEIAKQLGISEGTSKSQFSRAKAALRNMLSSNPSIGQLRVV